MIVFHGTSHYLASKILSSGQIEARGAGIYNRRGAVFFTDHEPTAAQYAIQRGDGEGVVFKCDVPKRWLRYDGGALTPGSFAGAEKVLYRIFHTSRSIPAEMIVSYHEVRTLKNPLLA